MRWRWLVIGLVVVVVGAVVAALVFANRLINANRDRILVAAEAFIGRPVHVGEIGARFFGRPGVRLTEVSIAEDPAFGADPFIQAQSATVLLKLRALIEGRIEVSRVELVKPSVRLVRDANGRLNYTTLGAPAAPGGSPPPPGAPPPAAPADGPALAWVVALFDIEDGEILYVDQEAKPPKTTALKKIQLEASDIALEQPMHFSLRAAYDAADENIDLNGDVGPVQAADGVAFALRGSIGPLPPFLPAVLSKLNLTGRARERGIDFESCAFDGFAGSVSGSGTLPLGDRAPFSMLAKAQGISIKEVLPVAAPQFQQQMDGTANVEVDVQGMGADPQALRQSLRGTVRVDVADGVLHDFNLLGEVVGRLANMPGLSKLIARGVKPKYAAVMNRPNTRFDRLQLHLRLIENGADVQDMILDGEDFGATATGRVTLPKTADISGQVLLSRRFSADVAADIKDARILFDGNDQIALPFTYRGVIGEAKPEPDLEKLGSSVLKGRGQELLDGVLKGGQKGEGAAEALGRGLRDLLGR